MRRHWNESRELLRSSRSGHRTFATTISPPNDSSKCRAKLVGAKEEHVEADGDERELSDVHREKYSEMENDPDRQERDSQVEPREQLAESPGALAGST
jgi:hypothetical protein